MGEGHGESTGEILKSLVVNVLIAASKGVAAVISGSGAMLAETLHSTADCGNQLLLLRGVKATKRPPDKDHPLGHGRQLYFYSFIVALLLFFGGGVFSIHEGVHKILEPEPVEDIRLALAILGFSLALEGWSCYGNVVELDKRRGETPFFQYLRETKDTDLIVVFGENSAAVLGLLLAGTALILAHFTGDGRWDGIGSLSIGLVLVGVAVFLAREVHSLLVGESADKKTHDILDDIAEKDPNIEKVLNVITLQQGPGEVMLAMKVQMRAGMTTDELVAAINAFEREIKNRTPHVKWSFIEPDNDD
jgi:cation diffusion facilitator family transporter